MQLRLFNDRGTAANAKLTLVSSTSIVEGGAHDVVVKDEKKSNDDVTVFYKLIRANVENPVDWEFALVFHHASGKVCLISGYSSSETNSPVAYIINNLKFL